MLVKDLMSLLVTYVSFIDGMATTVPKRLPSVRYFFMFEPIGFTCDAA